MAQYKITGPDGAQYKVTAPDNATHEQLVSYVKTNYKNVAAPTETKKSPKFYEIEKHPGAPQGVGGFLQQFGRQFKDAATSPMPGSMLTMPVKAMQETASQVGADVARAAEPTIGTIPARIAGFGTSAALDPTSYISAGTANVGKAVIPAERSMAVKLAEELGAPVTRAEATGSKAAGTIESGLEKTISGSDIINKTREVQLQKLTQFKDKLKSVFGTDVNKKESGDLIKQSIQDSIDANKQVAKHLYSQIPDVPVQTRNLENAASDILEEQLKLPSSNQDKELIKMASEYAGLQHTRPNPREAFYLERDLSSPLQISSNPTSLSTLRSIQSDLGSKLEQAKRAGQSTTSPTGRSLARFMKAIEDDIDALSSADDPLLKYVGKDAAETLTKANSVWGAMRAIDSNKLVKSIRKAAPEDIPDLIFKSGNATDVITARAAMSEEAFKAAKQHFYTDLISDPKIESKLNKMDANFLRSVFNSSELNSLHKVVALKKLFGSAEKMSGTVGSSRTNATAITGGAVGGGLTTAAMSAMHGNLPGVIGGLGAAAAAAYGPKLAAKAYLKYGMKGVNIPLRAPGAGQTAIPLSKALDERSKAVLEKLKAKLHRK